MATGTERPPLGAEGFERLLEAFGGSRDEAGERYESLRRKLLAFFEWNGADEPEALVDKTFDRVCRKLAEGEVIRAADPGPYVRAVAKNILRESWAEGRQREAQGRLRPEEAPAQDEGLHACLDRCLARLPERSRALVLRYYSAQGLARIEERKALAEELGVPLNALRIRMHRLRGALEECIRRCLPGEVPETNRPKAHLETRTWEKP